MNRVLTFFLLSGAAVHAVDFSREVLPVLQRACFECHGAEEARGGLRLHEKAAISAGGKHGAVITAGKPDESELLRRVSLPRTDKEAMPRRGTPLTKDEIAKLREWIAAGAVWPETVTLQQHWAYVPPVKPAVPQGAAHPLDAFTRARLAAEGLAPSAPAAPETIARRLHLDLTGIPPVPAEVEHFVKDHAADAQGAVERLADRLLNSPDYGVKWARHWLDLARYADSHGFQRDDLRQIWGWRDWVVSALNADKPFDEFSIEQIAGDLLPNATPEQVIATGFHRCTPTNVEAGTEPEESRINQVIDRVNTTGAVWLGSTLECAQCHNHKYDPFTQQDYYRLLAYFNNTEREAERSNPKVPGSIAFKGSPMEMRDTTQEQERAALQKQLEEMDARISAHAKKRERPAKKEKIAAITALKPLRVDTESASEAETRDDASILFIGEAPDGDTYTLELDLPTTPVHGILIEVLTDPSLPGDGPGRGDATRPNFVLQELHAELLPPGKDKTGGVPLKFARARASFSQARFDVAGLIDEDPATGWAINPQFHKPHWAALAFEKPLPLEPGSRLGLRLVQHFGGKRVIGRLRVSAFNDTVEEHLPEPVDAGDDKAAKDPVLARLEAQRKALQRKLDALKPATSEVMRELPEPRMTSLFKRGEYTNPGDPVTAAVPALFEKQPEGAPNRLTLARWLVSRDNPLAARVTVNRIWNEVFGRGIVATVEDFGIKGTPPTHPELLDWLAVEFMDQGWSLKKLLRLIVTSQTYQQSSHAPANAAAQDKDPENLLLWRMVRFRLDAEGIRDNALAIAGLLNPKQGGPPIYPPQPDGLWAKVGGQQYKYEVSPGAEKHRRGLYVVLKRGAPYPSFVNFDSGPRMACVVKRHRSNTPLQALNLLNDPVYVEAAQALAQRIISEKPGANAEQRIRHGFRLALSRTPTPTELAALHALWQKQYVKSETAAFEAVALALLNLDETISKE
ncbi:MAG TPA: hypothetical protein DIT64_06705 [Verrucomicrobiales bacterium]|nr:hypothetical protein [Verrucomicrobiales bacterium]